jgi:hypothetical protein
MKLVLNKVKALNIKLQVALLKSNISCYINIQLNINLILEGTTI